MGFVAFVGALLTIAFGGIAVASPPAAFTFYRRWLSPTGLALAAALRAGFALALLHTPGSGPGRTFLDVAAVLLLVGAVIGPVIGIERARRIVDWEARQPVWAVRAAGLAVVLFGFGVVVALLGIHAAPVRAAVQLLLRTLQVGVDPL